MDNLLKVDLSRLGELPLRELETGNDVYMRGGNLRVLAISTDADNRENVESREIPATETTMEQLLKMVLVSQREVKEMKGGTAQPAHR